jgi:hypothetical protein
VDLASSSAAGSGPYLQEGLGGVAAPRTLEEIRLLISGGDEVKPYRRLAEQVLDRWNHMLDAELRSRHIFRDWDYTKDASRDEDIGHFADRSIRAVEESEGVIAICADVVTPTSGLEIRHVYELRELGQQRELWFLVVPTPEDHHHSGGTPLHEFVQEIRRDFGKERIYHRVEDPLDLQASLIFEMMPWAVRRVGSAFGLGGGGAS